MSQQSELVEMGKGCIKQEHENIYVNFYIKVKQWMKQVGISGISDGSTIWHNSHDEYKASDT